MIFGKQLDSTLTFKNQVIEQVGQYKYLGNIVGSTQRQNSDVFKYNYDYLCGKSRKAMFGITKRLPHLGNIPPQTMIHLYESCVQPILTYGSDV